MSSIGSTRTSISVPNDIMGKLDQVAAVLGQDRSQVMLKAFGYFLEREGMGILSDAEGIVAVDRGETEDWATALGWIDAAIERGAATRPS